MKKKKKKKKKKINNNNNDDDNDGVAASRRMRVIRAKQRENKPSLITCSDMQHGTPV